MGSSCSYVQGYGLSVWFVRLVTSDSRTVTANYPVVHVQQVTSTPAAHAVGLVPAGSRKAKSAAHSISSSSRTRPAAAQERGDRERMLQPRTPRAVDFGELIMTKRYRANTLCSYMEKAPTSRLSAFLVGRVGFEPTT